MERHANKMKCFKCEQPIKDGEFYQGQQGATKHVECPQVDYLPVDEHTGVYEIDGVESVGTIHSHDSFSLSAAFRTSRMLDMV